jgi:pyruvate dehydrogenase E2 component (dihydrolipoamide acetyltransferase)
MASITLIAPAGLGPEIDHDALTGIARASRVESLAPWLKRLTATPDGISWDFARAAMLARNDPKLRAAQLDLADALFPDGVQGFDVRAALERVTAPTAVIWGRSDHIMPWRHALAAQGEIALHLLREIGHIPHVECPGIVAGVLARSMRQADRQ